MNIAVFNRDVSEAEKLSAVISELNAASEIYTVSSYAEAENIFLHQRIDVLFAEPDYDPEETEKYLRSFKKINPRLNIIITSSERDFMERAFVLHVSGYLLRPSDSQKVKEQLDNLLYPCSIEIITFGNFGIYVNGKAVSFRRSKSCEALAFLVDRRTPCSRKQIAACIFEDRTYDRSCQKYTDNILRDLAADLKAAGAEGLFIHTSNSYSVNSNVCICDYYEYLAGNRKILKKEEYMSQYSWAEETLAMLK